MIGQAEIMEYAIFVIIAVFIIAFVLFMVFGFQFLSAGSEASQETERQSLVLLQSLLSSRTLGNLQYQKLSVLDDSKLTAAMSLDCSDIETLFGQGVWINVTAFTEIPDCSGLTLSTGWVECDEARSRILETSSEMCSDTNYPDCGMWVLCEENRQERMTYRSVPVNIYRKLENRVGIGVITIGLGVGN